MTTAADGRSSMHPTGMHSFLVFETEPLGLDARCAILDRGRGLHIFTGRNEVAAKVMFLHVSVILFTGGVSGEPPGDQADHHHPPGPRRTPRD